MIWVLGDKAAARGYAPTELAAEGGIRHLEAESLVALREGGPFKPLFAAMEAGAFRDELARALPIPSLRHDRRLRLGLLALVAPSIVMLLELDRENILGHHTSASRLFVDLVLGAYIGFELSRPTPRTPSVAALALVAIAFRWILIVTRLCGHAHPLVMGAAALPVLAAVVILARVPSRARVVRELLGKLGVSRSEQFAAHVAAAAPPRAAGLAAAVACAAMLPLIAHLARLLQFGLVIQACAFLAFAAIAPRAVTRMGRDSPSKRKLDPREAIVAFAAGLALTAAAVTFGRLFFDSGLELARCVGRLSAEAKAARAAESTELRRAVENVRTSVPLILMTATAFPIAEERIFRGILQDFLVRRYGRAYGIFAASIAFGIAHLGVYQLALHEIALVGLGFGLAYAEGGLVASILAHATWNLLQLI